MSEYIYKTNITDELELEIINSYTSNLKNKEICAKFNIKYPTIYRILLKYNIPKKGMAPRTRFGDSIKCHKCNLIENKSFFICVKKVYRTLCKKCHSDDETRRRSLRSSEEKKEVGRKSYSIQKERRKQGALGMIPIEKQIDIWVKRAITRNDKRDRVNLCKKLLIEKCFKAKKLYPNIIFCFVENLNLNRSMIASLDKIIPSQGYTNENTQVIPLWLNSAKLNSTQEEFDNNILEYIEKNKHLCEKILDRLNKNR